MLAEANRCCRRRDVRDQRVNVAVDFRLLVPIGIGVLGERLTFRDDIIELAAPAMAALVRGEAVEQGLTSGLLQFHIERGVNAQTALMDLIATVLAFQIAADFLHEMRCERIRVLLHAEHDRLPLCLVGLRGCNLAVLEHGIEHEVATLEGSVRVIDRRIILRRFRQAREQRSFFEPQLAGGLAEIVFGRCLVPICAMPEKYLVGVERKDLWLGKAPLDLDGEQ